MTYHNKKGDDQLEVPSLAIAELQRRCNIDLVAALSHLLIEFLFPQVTNTSRNQTDIPVLVRTQMYQCYDVLQESKSYSGLAAGYGHIPLWTRTFASFAMALMTVRLVTRHRMRKGFAPIAPSSLNTGCATEGITVSKFTWYGSQEHDRSWIAPLSACPLQLRGVSQHQLRFRELYAY